MPTIAVLSHWNWTKRLRYRKFRTSSCQCTVAHMVTAYMWGTLTVTLPWECPFHPHWGGNMVPEPPVGIQKLFSDKYMVLQHGLASWSACEPSHPVEHCFCFFKKMQFKLQKLTFRRSTEVACMSCWSGILYLHLKVNWIVVMTLDMTVHLTFPAFE